MHYEDQIGETFFAEIADLTPLDETPSGNPNEHDDESITHIAASLKRFGQQKPLVIRRDGVVLAGNGVLEAAKLLDWDKILVQVSHLVNGEDLAYSVADNKTSDYSVIDIRFVEENLSTHLKETSLDGLGFDIGELQDILKSPLSDGETEEPDDIAFASPITMTKDQREVFERAYARMKQVVDDGPGLSEGRCVEFLSAEFLAQYGDEQDEPT